MKKYIFALLFGFFLLGSPSVASAHELLPKPVLQYLTEHPQATPEEIQAFAQTQSPEIAQKFKDKDEVIKLISQRGTSFFDNFKDFVKLGVGHILSGPDHILFVLTLVLVFVSIREILKLTSTFTVAHSITLVLAGTGILTLPSRIVEPLIAASILYVAITSVFFAGRKFIGENRGKIVMVFFFGLFHGLGFAGLLKEINIPTDRFVSSLLAFNIGIELGQLTILAIVLPPIYYFRDRPWYSTVIKVIAAIISLIALFWIIQRIFFSWRFLMRKLFLVVYNIRRVIIN